MNIRIIYWLFILLALGLEWGLSQSGFLNEQKKYHRVRAAFAEKADSLMNELSRLGIESKQLRIYIRAFKMEKILQLWVKAAQEDTFALMTNYDFCTSCGDLGPKRRQGDFQIPEGYYYIDRFNPHSIFYLSLGINYPNRSDRILGGRNPGGDIFIHGNCVTIGCIPITDDKIKELYLFAVFAKHSGQKTIRVDIFPYLFDNPRSQKGVQRYTSAKLHKAFWKNLRPGYDYFQKHHRPATVQIDEKNGNYLFRTAN